MRLINDAKPWATIMMAVLVGIAAIAGGVVVIVNPDSLSFEKYLDLLKNFAIAVGIVGIGRGIASYGKQTSEASMLKDDSLLASAPAERRWSAGGDGVGSFGESWTPESFGEEPWAEETTTGEVRPPLEG